MDWLETLSPLSSTTAEGATTKLSFPWAAAQNSDAPDLRKVQTNSRATLATSSLQVLTGRKPHRCTPACRLWT